ncbi:hypothetical protein OROGR_004291 [Orobanche gracilis]
MALDYQYHPQRKPSSEYTYIIRSNRVALVGGNHTAARFCTR